MPTLYLITGANGAGKSSVGPKYLPGHIRNHYTVFDGDKVYATKLKELWPEKIKALKEAKKLAIAFVGETLDQLLNDALLNKDDFVYEGHFPSYATWEFPLKFKAEGYEIHMLYMGLSNVDLSAMRVAMRAKKGGHHVSQMGYRK